MPVSPEEQRRIDNETADRLEKENARRDQLANANEIRRKATQEKQRQDRERAAEVRNKNK